MSQSVFVSSIPERNNELDMFCPIAAFRFSQTLLGKNAQIASLARLMKTAKKNVIYCRRPELISAAFTKQFYSTSYFSNTAIDWNDAIHIRFDMARNCRVLKDVRNIVVSDSTPRRESLPLSVAARDNEIYPASVERLLAYSKRSVSKHPNNELLPTKILSESYLFADLAGWNIDNNDPFENILDIVHTSAAYATSVAELSSMSSAKGPIDRITGERSDFINALLKNKALSTSARNTIGNNSFVLIPFNLEDDGATVESLVISLIETVSRYKHDLNICVAPYNMNIINHARLARFIEKCQLADKSGKTWQSTFLCFFQADRAIPFLGTLFNAVIIDGSDPDASWTFKRLAVLNSRTIIITNQDNMVYWKEHARDSQHYEVSEKMSFDIQDWYGRRVLVSQIISHRDAKSLIELASLNKVDRIMWTDYRDMLVEHPPIDNYLE